MIDPVFGIRHAVEHRALNVEVLIRGVEVDVAHPRRLARQGVRDADLLEEGWYDQVNVLARVGEEAHHGEGDEGAHGAAVVVAREAVRGRGEEGGDVEVGALGREARPAGVVVLEHRQEGGLVADVGDVLVVEVVETADEGLWPTVEGY